MKIITSFFLIVTFIASSVLAQVPRQISYQGVIADASGKFISDGAHTLTLKLYEEQSGSAPAIHSETQSVVVIHGVFNAMIGTGTGIPASVSFDRAYFLGVAVDGGSELSQRTPLVAAPYAIRAAYADVAGSVVGGGTAGVSSLNSIGGDIKLEAAGSAVITNNTATKTITISATGGSGSSGIQGVQSTDGTLTITNANGPVTTLGIANNAITPAKILDSSITASKLVSHLLPTTLPPTGKAGGDLSGNYPNPNVERIQGFKVSSNAPGTGQVLSWEDTNWIAKSFPGFGLPYSATDNTPNIPSVDITNTGASTALRGTGSIGVAGVSTNAAGGLGVSGSGGLYGVSGTSQVGNGVGGVSTKLNGIGVEGIASNGATAAGVSGASATGIGVKASYTGGANNGIPLQIDNGYIKVSGTTKTAFIHTVTPNNIVAIAPWVTFMNYPSMAATDIVLITHSLNAVPLRQNIGGNVFEGTSYGVQWNAQNARWEIFLESNQGVMPQGETFNVLVIKQ